MGIINFAKVIELKFSSIVRRKIDLSLVNTLAVDFNGTFYTSAEKTYITTKSDEERAKKYSKGKEKLEEEFLQYIIDDINKYMSEFSPRNNLIITVDGTANAGKMSQQKSRRFKGVKENKNPFLPVGSFSPGTQIMEKIDKRIKNFFTENKDILPDNTIYSSYLDPGEGEHKIFHILKDEKYKGDGINIIYGADNDLFVLSLLSEVENLYLYKDNTKKFYSIDKARKITKSIMRFSGCDEELLIKDFSILLFFAGNDFLPQYPNIASSVESFDLVLEAYKVHKKHLTDKNNNIQWKNYLNIFNYINNYKYNLYVYFNYSEERVRFPYVEVRESMKGEKLDFSTFRNKWYEKQFRPVNDKLYLEYSKKEDKEIEFYTEEDINTMCKKMCQTIQWNHLYYTEGYKNVNNLHFYNFLYTPLTEDMENYIAMNLNNKNNISLRKEVQYNHDNGLNIMQQLLSILAPQSKSLLPLEWQKVYKLTYPINPEDFIVMEPEGTNAAHHILVKIPDIDPLFIKYIVEKFEEENDIKLSYPPSEGLWIINNYKNYTGKIKISEKILM